MRLIDANVVKSIFNILAEKGPEESIRIWEQCVSIIDDVETVDAIPIEWIKEWEQKDENFFLYMGLTKKLIEDWEKKNE